MLLYYQLTVIVSFLLSGVFLLRWRKDVSVHFALIFVIIPIIDLGYFRVAAAAELNEALLANSLEYFTGCFLEFFFLLYLMQFCKLRAPKPVMAILLALGGVIYYAALTTGKYGWLYSSAELRSADGVSYLVKEYGPLHTWYYALIFFYLAANLALLIYSFIKKKRTPRCCSLHIC